MADALNRLGGQAFAEVGLLSDDPDSDASEVPLALVCRFSRVANEAELDLAHRLAWNFCQAKLLVTIDATGLRAWSACEPPVTGGASPQPNPRRDILGLIGIRDDGLLHHGGDALRWVNLSTGRFFEDRRDLFQPERRADRMLLANLTWVRERLIKHNLLPADLAHDLLARVMFIQFLFDRTDSMGHAALSQERLDELRQIGVLRQRHTTLASILRAPNDARSLFRWLNNRFNGDLFPAKSSEPKIRETEWLAEEAAIRAEHLALLADFVEGRQDAAIGQYQLWPYYRFDALPLEFISSIYESFVTKTKGDGVHYTPGRLADIVLDGVLPWNSPNWDVRVLDPACGSGIFLVKSFQRLVHRWRQAHMGSTPPPDVLAYLLERNIAGIDKAPDAARVASFSLYLAMCDSLDPRSLWHHVEFPTLRGRRIRVGDAFCDDDLGSLGSKGEAGYDVVVGNAPWGEDSVTQAALTWESKQEPPWPRKDKDIGPSFVGRAIELTRPGGMIALIQGSGPWLHHQAGSCVALRERIFNSAIVAPEEVLDLTRVRRTLFPSARGPACVLTLRIVRPERDLFTFIRLRDYHIGSIDGREDISIEAEDVFTLSRLSVLADSSVFAALTWGGWREWYTIRRLRDSLGTMGDFMAEFGNRAGEGFKRGIRHTQPIPWARKLAVVESTNGLPEDSLSIDVSQLPRNIDTEFNRMRFSEGFSGPQLIVRKSIDAESQRFQAWVTGPAEEGILCSASFVSVEGQSADFPRLLAIALLLRSRMPAWYLQLTSGRVAETRGEALSKELKQLPIPDAQTLVDQPWFAQLISNWGRPLKWAEIDEHALTLWGLSASERILVEDFEGWTEDSLHRTTRSWETGNSVEIRAWCEVVAMSIRDGFGGRRTVCFIAYEEKEQVDLLPVRVVRVIFGGTPHGSVQIVPVGERELLQDRVGPALASSSGGMPSYSRTVRGYATVVHEGVTVPAAWIVKADRRERWSKTAALRDADIMVMDILRAGRAVNSRGEQ